MARSGSACVAGRPTTSITAAIIITAPVIVIPIIVIGIVTGIRTVIASASIAIAVVSVGSASRQKHREPQHKKQISEFHNAT
jgi:hypothetical protein